MGTITKSRKQLDPGGPNQRGLLGFWKGVTGKLGTARKGEILMAGPAALLGAPEPDIEPGTIEHILHAIRLHLDMDVAFVSRVTPDAVLIQHTDSRGVAPFAVGDRFDPEEGYCQRIIDGRIPHLIADTSKHPEVANLACTKAIPIGTHISVPITLSDGSVYGTFCCFSHSRKRSLNQRDLQMMKAFAEAAAGQIDAKKNGDQHAARVSARILRTIERNNFATVYQPIFRLQDSKVVGVECLTRFEDSDKRSPYEWFAEADQVGLGLELEIAALRNALRGINYVPKGIYLAVNVSPDAILSGEVQRALAKVPPERIVLEITEHAMIRNYAALHDALFALHEQVRIAVDDVGAGYSGLAHILEVRPDIIKLDMSLTRGVDRDPARAALATALVVFANEIGSTIVAEGIETLEEREALTQRGVSHGQGYSLARPMPIAALEHLLLEHS